MKRFYTEAPFTQNGLIELEAKLSHYLSKVLRLKPDDSIQLFDGKGKEAFAKIIAVSKQGVSVQIETLLSAQPDSPLHLHLGQVISKGDRFDYAIQKSVELGVTEITPLFSERCDVKLPKDRQAKRLQHWQGIAISAAEQCGRSSVPTVNGIQTLSEWVASQSQGLVLNPHQGKSLTNLAHQLDATRPISLLIGPEGGLTEGEVLQAENSAFYGCSLGPRVLRTETAPVVVLSGLQLLLGDFS